jgi:peptidoglycan/LPS O-acetylase OafA/YrhL
VSVGDESRGVRLPYEPALDGLRAVAITFVVVYHATGTRYPATGLAGVDVFFVLSGFLITTLLLRERRLRGRVSVRDFYERRAWRLLPALLVLLGIVTAFLAITGEAVARWAAGVVGGLFYGTNVILATGHVDDVPLGLTHLWSLAAEEQFYLIWPVVLVLVLRTRPYAAALVCGAAIVVLQYRGLELVGSNASPYRIYFGADTRSLPIVAGCLLAVLWSREPVRRQIERVAGKTAPIAALCLCVLVYVGWGTLYFAGPLLVVAVCSCLLIANAFDRGSLLARGLSIPPVVWLGRISYSLYLWHQPVLVAFGVYGAALTLRAVPGVAVSLAAASASYFLIERPLLRRRSLRGARSTVGSAERRPTSRALLETPASSR